MDGNETLCVSTNVTARKRYIYDRPDVRDDIASCAHRSIYQRYRYNV